MKQVVLQSLDRITTGYSVFEEDQVLTHKQLNTVSDYFDDQTRLTRVKLLGVGIVCGLHVSVTGTNVTLSKGAGVTTDGDLLYFAADTLFAQYKLYDNSNPTYAPFAAALDAKSVFELMPRVHPRMRDPLAIDLRRFRNETGFALDQMVAVLFMEGYVKDEDLCTGTDCDNLGQNFINTIKLLVMDKALARALQEGLPDSDRMARTLADVVANRAVIPTPFTSTNQLVALYRATCQSIHNNLALEFAKLDRNFWPLFFGDKFAPQTAAGWMVKLNQLRASFTADSTSIQYYYDFLKDLADTYNDFRQQLLGDTTWCCPDTDSFPKHLLLGNVVPGPDPAENRTGFYPSPLASRTVEQLNHAAFLAQKLDASIEAFQRPARTNTIRITPSRFEDACLEERAIPYYYPINAANPIQTRWSYRLHRQNMDAWNYSYNADRYNPPALGGAANPLASQIGRYPFFRIEGHLGQPVATAEAAIEAQVKASNLPFVVQSVHLGTERRLVIRKPGIRYTDFHRFNQILRSDLALQLDDVKTFSADYVRQVNELTTAHVTDPVQEKAIASQKNQSIGNEVLAARTVLNQNYSQYHINSTAWRPSVRNAMTLSAQFKENLGKVTKTEYPTPFDSFISTSHAHWLDWSDIILQHNDDKETDKLLFSNFQATHPGLEHFAGVVRGGTFVLVYDDTGRVIADFMLPYHCCEVAPEVQPLEPVLGRPDGRPDFDFKEATVLGGIRLTATADKFVEGHLTEFTQRVIDPKIQVQSQNFDFFRNSMTTVASVFHAANSGRNVSSAPINFADSLVAAAVNETRAKQQKAEILREKAGDPALGKQARGKLAAEAKKAEAELAKSINATAAHVSDSGMDVSTGSEGFNALMEISAAIGNITDKRARTSMKTGLKALQKQTANAGLKTMLSGMINL